MLALLPRWYLLVAAGLFGATAGSFANVVIYRLPRGISIVTPRSRCPSCGHALAWWENIPIASWLALRGRCSRCREPISQRYPLVEAITAMAWAAAAAVFGWSLATVAFGVFLTALIILSAIDLEHFRLPNRVLLPAGVAGAALLAITSAVERDFASLRDAAIGACVYGVPLLALVFAYPRGMGGGDAKLALYLGMHLGWMSLGRVAIAALSGVFIGAAVAILLLALKIKTRKDRIPFGPSMAAGGVVAVFWGDLLLHLWLGSV